MLRDGDLHATGDVEDAVHGAWVVQVVGGDERGVERPGRVGTQDLPDEAVLVHSVAEHFPDLEIVLADVVVEVAVLGLVGIGGRIHGVGANVTERAGHADDVRTNEVAVVVVDRVVVVPLRVPPGLGPGVEVRVREDSQAHDTARAAVGVDVQSLVEVILGLAGRVEVETVLVRL